MPIQLSPRYLESPIIDWDLMALRQMITTRCITIHSPALGGAQESYNGLLRL